MKIKRRKEGDGEKRWVGEGGGDRWLDGKA